MRDLDILDAFGNPLDDRGNDREGTCDRAGDDDDADHDQHQGDTAEAGQDEGQFAVDFGLCGNPFAAFGIDPGERLQILVQRGADGAVFVIVAPFAAGGGVDLDRAADQLFSEIDKLLDALFKRGKLFGVVGPNDLLPFLHDAEDLFVELE